MPPRCYLFSPSVAIPLYADGTSGPDGEYRGSSTLLVQITLSFVVRLPQHAVMRAYPLAVATVLLGFITSNAAVLTVINTNDTGPGSLHEAILEANAAPGADEIRFNIPGTGVRKIEVNRIGLPEITDPVTIDGYTQPGASPNTLAIGNNAVILIHLDGKNDWSGPVNGIVISGGNSLVRGLSITGIPSRVYLGIPENPPPPPPEGDAIQLKTNGGNLIEGNFIGLAPSGASTGYYTYRGIEVLSSDNKIGGTAPASRNVISRQNNAIVSTGHRTVIEGNYLGTDPSGFVVQNNGGGVVVGGDDVRIGGTSIGAGNLLTGSQTNVQVTGSARGTIIQGNLIGTKVDGSGNLGSLSKAITIYGSQTLVGGLEPGAGNRISFAISGIRVAANNAVGNTVFSNVFNAGYDHDHIALSGFGGNDLGDSDVGANNLQNFPVITSVKRSSDSTRVIGGLNSAASTEFTLQFFVNRRSSTGDALLGTRSVTTDGSGVARFDFTLPGFTAANEFISATATDAEGNTSQFFPEYGRVQLANISTRGNVGTGDNALIGGFVIHRPPGFNGDFRKKVLIRALGPSMSGAGVPPERCIADPYLELYNSSGQLIATNDNWRSDQAQEIIGTGAAPSNDFEAAALVTLGDAGYTVQVRGANGSAGLGIVEVFDLDPLDPINQPNSGRLMNISTRGYVSGGDDLMIGGLIVNGDAGQPVVVRAIGPDLTAVGVPGALSDPTLELRDASGTLMAFNDNWRDAQEEELQETAFAPNDNRDSAVRAALVPGNYTAIVRGGNNTAGVALIEVYALE